MTDEVSRFTLPDADAMANRLVAVDGAAKIVQRFYPELIKHAGERMTPAAFVMCVKSAFDELTYATTEPGPARRAFTIAFASRLHTFARALIDDADVLDQVLDIYWLAGLPVGLRRSDG